MSTSRVFASLAAALLAATALIGCAGNGGGVTGAGISYAGSYKADFTLDGGKKGALALTVAPDSKASGVLTVTAPAPGRSSTREGFSFTVGTLTITGSVANGQLNVTGTDPASGGFTLTGSLPTSPSDNTTLTLTAGGTNYTAQCLISQGGGTGSLTFTNSGANINTAAFPSNPYILISSVAGSSAIVAIPSVTDNSRSILVTLGSTATAGSTIDLATSIETTAGYYEKSTDLNWEAKTGSIKVLSRTDSSVSIQFIDPVFTCKTSPGSFKLTGTITK